MQYHNSSLKLDDSVTYVHHKDIRWKSPSNIALIKYWGKHGVQLPRNPSISFTLTNAFTETRLSYSLKERPSEELDLVFFFEDKENFAFQNRIELFLTSILPIFPFLIQLKLKIHSNNSFPHSSGIASSASSMSALALCLCSMENQLFGTLNDKSTFLQKASYIARLGSGSACRSIYPKLGMWGAYLGFDKSSDLFAIPMEEEANPIFHTFQNDILIVSSAKKSVSSSAGHQLMEGNIFANSRYQQANQNMMELLDALKNGNIEKMGDITEIEALSLHALMMTSNYMLMYPNSLEIMKKIRHFRKEQNIPVYFSLDAGPNIHLLYPESVSHQIKPFIKEELIQLCEDRFWLQDRVGDGPVEY